MRTRDIIFALLPALVAWAVGGCSLDDPADPSDQVNPAGPADAATRYVAIGNSLTAGFMDAGLMQAGQAASFPQLIAAQMGDEDFSQPWIAAPGIGSSDPSSPDQIAGVLYFDGAGLSVLGETPLAEIESLLLARTQPTPYHNMGVPGAKLVDGMNAYSSLSSSPVGNSFFDFINRATLFGNQEVQSGYPDGMGGVVPVAFQTGSMFYTAVVKGAGVVTVWLGNNDVLGPATGGNPAPGFGPAGAADFQSEFTALVSMLGGGLAQRNGFPPTIVVANIPSITDIPYFIPVATFEAAFPWPGGYEEAGVSHVLFPTIAWIQSGVDPSTPVPGDHTLTTTEASDVATAVATYNAIIEGVVTAVDASGVAEVALMDANALMAGLDPAQKTHFLFLVNQGMDVETAAATTLFSLDGIHPNNVGYGVVANAFIEVINATDGSSIPLVPDGALSWDPTYGQPIATAAAAPPRIGTDAAARLAAIFR